MIEMELNCSKMSRVSGKSRRFDYHILGIKKLKYRERAQENSLTLTNR